MNNFFPITNSDLRVVLSIFIVVLIAIFVRLILLRTAHLFNLIFIPNSQITSVLRKKK